MNDSTRMRRALALAAKANNRASPNPKVGCVIVKKNRVVGEGYHEFFGGPHAEAKALEKAGGKAKGATVYVTLEPCVHEDKKTPPCVPALVNAKVKRVVVAALDANPKVRGRGIKALRAAGVKVRVGLLRKEAVELNNPFTKWVTKKMPYVVLKMASTLDGKITSSRKWISNTQARKMVQHMRAQADAILVGANTSLADDPRLTCRVRGAKQPLRVVLDSGLRSPTSARVFKDSNSVVFTTKKAPAKKIDALRKKGVTVMVSEKIGIEKVLKELAGRNVAFLLVEGGSKVASSFLRERLVDKAYFFVAPVLAGKGVPLVEENVRLGFKNVKTSMVGNNVLFETDCTK